jgi:hypothetical protein
MLQRLETSIRNEKMIGEVRWWWLLLVRIPFSLAITRDRFEHHFTCLKLFEVDLDLLE